MAERREVTLQHPDRRSAGDASCSAKYGKISTPKPTKSSEQFTQT